MIHFTHFQTLPKILRKFQKFQSRDKIPNSESTVQYTQPLGLAVFHTFLEPWVMTSQIH